MTLLRANWLFVIALLLFGATALATAEEVDVEDASVTLDAIISDDEAAQVKALLGLRAITAADLGRALIPIEVVAPDLAILDPLPIPVPPCRGVEPADIGYLFRFVNSGRFAARKCPGTNCVRIFKCPGTGSVKCFEILTCQGAGCRRFKSCCNGQFSLQQADQGVRFVAGKKFLRQRCGSCFNLLDCPASSSSSCETLAPCTGAGCSLIVPCPPSSTETTTTAPTTTTVLTTTTTTTTRPCNGFQLRVVVNGTRLVLVNNLEQPSVKLIPCDAAGNCLSAQACKAADIKNGVRCYNAQPCTSDPAQPRCIERVTCPQNPCNGISEVKTDTGYSWVTTSDPQVVSFRKVPCSANNTGCFRLSRCTADEVKLGLCSIQRSCTPSTTGTPPVDCLRQVAC